MGRKIQWKSLLGILATAFLLIFMVGCEGDTGPAGPAGADGTDGVDGTDGADGNAPCLDCHNTDDMNAIGNQYTRSGHALGEFVDYAGGRSSCAHCHSGNGFIEFMTTGEVDGDINNPEPIHLWHLGFVGIGAVLMGIMTYIKSRFVGFPIHPIGMTLGLTNPIYNIWFSVFIAWLFKAVILKYGGAKLYLRIRPFFLGMVLGAFGSAGFWLIIDAFTGMSGNSFTLS